MSYIKDQIEIQRQEEWSRYSAKQRSMSDEGRGMESLNVTTCPHCDRATVLEEHIWTPQRKLFGDDREQTYFTCEWCGSEVQPADERTPRKPAQTEIGERETEQIRRRA